MNRLKIYWLQINKFTFKIQYQEDKYDDDGIIRLLRRRPIERCLLQHHSSCDLLLIHNFTCR